jgi:hypothetical protein
MPLFFYEIYKRFINMQGASHFPNTLPTMVRGQAFRIIV